MNIIIKIIEYLIKRIGYSSDTFNNFNYYKLFISIALILLFNSFELHTQDTVKIEEIVNKTLYERDVVDMSDQKLGEDYFYSNTGTASWYGKKFHLRKTANGELFNMYEYTAAHRDLPFGTILKVTNVDNGLSVLVRINDRGPFIGNRILDLSYSASIEIGNTGLSKVLIEGFVPGRVNLGMNVPDNYFFGYSIISPLSFLQKSDVEIIGFFKDFNEGIRIYKNYLDRHSGSMAFIAIPAEQIMKKEKYADKFYLVVIDPRAKKKVKEIVRNLR